MITALASMQQDFAEYLKERPSTIGLRLAAGMETRLGVYANNFRGTLIDALRDSFERVHSWLGDDEFDAAAYAYIAARPPASWTLNDFGHAFADALDALWPDDPEVADLARIDWGLRRAFDAADDMAIGPAAAAEIDWDCAIVRPVASFALVECRTNAAAIWAALDTAAKPVPEPELIEPLAALKIWRRELSPQFCTAEPSEVLALALIAEGASFAFLCETLAREHGDAEAVRLGGEMLGRWIEDGLLRLETLQV